MVMFLFVFEKGRSISVQSATITFIFPDGIVHFRVVSQISLAFEFSPTNFTSYLCRFVITTFFVLLQCRATVKRTLANCTDIWSCVCMAIGMGYRIYLVDKTFATIITNE